MLAQILRYSHRVKQLGCKNLFLTIKYRLQKKLYKARFYKKNPNNNWLDVSKKLGVTPNFEVFFEQIKQNKTFESIFNELNQDNAELAAKNCFSVLGSQEICFDNNQIEWQKDFKAEQLRNTHKILDSQWQNQKDIFYQDIKISSPKNMQFNEYNPDIKVPWELSRFQHLTDLAMAYKKTSDLKFIETFTDQIESWINNNPAPRGVNWVCPMDTAIRAINWIHALHQFKNVENISLKFWQKIICSLYDHAIFIENNWEWSDRPNNHYLADLLGYLYLCELFCDSQKFKTAKQKTVTKILEQFFHQILPDGTAYEGSTNYHKLDTEMFLHFKILCQASQTTLPQEFHDRLNKMQEFLQDCTDCAGNLVQIGDNDSGKIVGGVVSSFVPIRLRSCSALASLRANELVHPVRGERSPPGRSRIHTNELIKTYPNFGLTIIKNKNLHLTFRHATFNSIQPTGHFHQDELAITLSVGVVPVLVDPGTYLYTANTKYRNLLRSAESHNTLYCKQENEFGDLFQLKRETCPIFNPNQISHSAENISFKSSHKTEFATAWRQLDLNLISNEIKISDYAESKQNNNWAWNLIFAPRITLEKIDTNFWEIKKEKNILLSIQTTLNFEETSWFYSAEYGKIEHCKKLTVKKQLHNIEHITIKTLK